MKIVLLILIVVALIVIGPLLLIWALNTLFGLGIDYNFWTWCAAAILGAAAKANVSKD